MTAFDLFSIGHSNIPAPRFTAMLRAAGADTIADVRSMPVSRFCPWFSAKNLAPLLAGEGMAYLFFGEELGGRPRDPSLYCEGITVAKSPITRRWRGSRASRPVSSVCCADAGASSPLPDVFGARAARLPSLPSGGARARRARLRRSAISCMTARSSRMRRPNSGSCDSQTRTTTSSHLDSTSDSRQRIAAARAPSPIGSRKAANAATMRKERAR